MNPLPCKPREPNRRDVLRIGGLAGAQLGLAGLFQTQAQGRAEGTFGRAKRVIMLFLHGGHPQQETFDPKPAGPGDVRGEFGAISTKIPGIQFSELLPRCAAIAEKIAVIRSVSHGNSNHVQACLPAQTGHKHPESVQNMGDFPPSESDFPPVGAVLDHLRPSGSQLPGWVRVGPLMRRGNGTTLHGQTPGFLGRNHSSFAVDQSLRADDVEIEALKSPAGLDSVRLYQRFNLRQQFNALRSNLDTLATNQTLDPYLEKAVTLLASPATQRAFDVAKEPKKVRERYGDTEFGQRCLLARRLVESGVPMVNVSYCHTPSGSWDTHNNHFNRMKDELAPDLDRAFTALVLDLEARGMLNDTLVVVNAEFGRTPVINAKQGRDHWPFVYSLAFAGAGLQAGAVFGESDASAAYPLNHPRGPADVATTIYHLLGVPAETVIYDQADRPHQLMVGRAITELLA